MSESGTEGSLRPRYYYNKGGEKEVTRNGFTHLLSYFELSSLSLTTTQSLSKSYRRESKIKDDSAINFYFAH